MSHVGIGSEQHNLLGDSLLNFFISFSVAGLKSVNNSGENIFSSVQVIDVELLITWNVYHQNCLSPVFSLYEQSKTSTLISFL